MRPPLAGGLRRKIVQCREIQLRCGVMPPHVSVSESEENPPEQDMTSLSPANADRLKLAFQECRDMEGARSHQNGGGENAPRPGDVMPPFILPDVTGRLMDLKSLLENGPVAVMFYRGHWCPYCTLNGGA